MKNKQLIASAAQLYKVGLTVERARKRLQELVEQGEPFNSEKMLRAYQEFVELDNKWKALEQEHLLLLEEVQRIRS